MNKLLLITAIISLAFTSVSCKSKKETTTKNTANTNEKEVKYRLIVSFISKGAGTDNTKRTAFIEYVNSHPKKPKFETINWGREGETDYCFNLKELTTKKEMVVFIEKVKSISGGSDMMQLFEDSESMHKAR